MKLLETRKGYIALRMQDVNTFNGMDSSVMGRKFAGLLVSPLLWISMVQAFFHSAGKVRDSQIFCISSVRYVPKYEQPLKQLIIMETLLN